MRYVRSSVRACVHAVVLVPVRVACKNSEALRGLLILIADGAIDKKGFNGAYAHAARQRGFVNFGMAEAMRALGNSSAAMRSAWYQKWNVHMQARPEALAGLVHNVKTGALSGPSMHHTLMENEELMERVAEANTAQNKGRERTYLLSQVYYIGSGDVSARGEGERKMSLVCVFFVGTALSS